MSALPKKIRGLGVERIMKKLQVNIELGQYYEAHQMYRTLYFRLLSLKKYDELMPLLYDGAILFLSHNQHNSGSDLAVLFVNVLSESQTSVTEDNMDKLGHLFSMMVPDSPERANFLTSALKWSGKDSDGCTTSSLGHPFLHQSVALTLWKEKNYQQSRYHFIHSSDGHGCATMLIEYHITKGYPSEVDLFIAQTVLHVLIKCSIAVTNFCAFDNATNAPISYLFPLGPILVRYLCLKNKTTASTAFYTYTEKHPAVSSGFPFLLPLLNFLQFLLQAIEREKLAYFRTLCEQYQPSLKRDPCYSEYVERIGQVFFGLTPPPKQQGLFGNLFQSLFEGFDDSFSEENSEPVPGSSKDSYKISQDELD